MQAGEQGADEPVPESNAEEPAVQLADESAGELARAREHLTLLAGQVSHDLRTPLTAILANAEMLAGEPAVSGDEDLAWMVGGIERAAHRMEAMIEAMVRYAREGGEPRLSVTRLGDVVEAVIEDLEPLVASSGAELVVGELPTVAADADQMYAVVVNLLTNALTFTRSDVRPRVQVSATRVAGSGDGSWRVSVSDNGIGVPEERSEAMFVLFARGDKRRGGSGTGLATVKRMVEAHGGRVGMHPAEGGGTTVWFELPA